MTLQHSPLDDRHRRLGAKLVPLRGWEMPIQYPSGTLAEHRACRTGAAAFDVSHLGTVRVTGPGAFDRLQRALTADLGKIGPGRAQYTHLLDPGDASVLDDIIVWWVADDQFDVMPNASNTDRVRDAIGGEDVAPPPRRSSPCRAPRPRPGWPRCRRRRRPSSAAGWRPSRCWATPCVVAGTGYLSEDVELAVPAAAAGRVWDAVVAAGVAPQGSAPATPCGWRRACRSTAGGSRHHPVAGRAGLGGGVGQGRVPGPRRPGRRAGAGRRPPRLRGLSVAGRRPPPGECPVVVGGERVGVVTSGNFSPTLGRASRWPSTAPGDRRGEVSVDIGGPLVPTTVVPTPFYSPPNR